MRSVKYLKITKCNQINNVIDQIHFGKLTQILKSTLHNSNFNGPLKIYRIIVLMVESSNYKEINSIEGHYGKFPYLYNSNFYNILSLQIELIVFISCKFDSYKCRLNVEV